MILRKPYAVFIKYFRLLHLILAAFTALVLYRSFTLYKFFNDYSVDYRSAMSTYVNGKYLNILSFFVVIIVIIIVVALLSVMIYKKKPKNMYIFNVLVFVGTLVLYYLTLSVLREVSSGVIDIRVSKAYRDFYLIVTAGEAISLVWFVIRSTGFDLKQFDFASDLQQLDISEADREEIEVVYDFDKDEFIRNAKSNFRNFKYFYGEHKFIINVISGASLIAIGLYAYLTLSAYTERHSEGESFDASNVTANVQDSFILDSDPGGKKLVDTEGEQPGAIVIVRLQLKGYGLKPTLNTGLTTLKIGDRIYSQNSKLANHLYDVGTPYMGELLNDELETYILAFEIPDSLSGKTMYFKFNDDASFIGGQAGAKSVLVRLKPEDVRKDGQLFEKKLAETINFDDSVIGATSLRINSYEISNKFKLNYNFCYRDNKCVSSVEYLTPTATGNYFKTLMKVSGELKLDKSTNISGVYDFCSFLNSFGTINYKIKGSWNSFKIDSKVVRPQVANTNDYFIEVPYEIEDAEEISLTLKIRNQNYKYTLK